MASFLDNLKLTAAALSDVVTAPTRALIPGGTGLFDAPLTAKVAAEQLRAQGDEEGARRAWEKASGGLQWVKEAAVRTADDAASRVSQTADAASRAVRMLTHPATLAVAGGALLLAILAPYAAPLLRRL